MNNSFLSRQNIEKQQLSIFLRDLSKNLNVNLKHMIEDCVISKKKEDEINSKKHTSKKKPIMKKKDIIIQQQEEIRRVKMIEDDKKKINYLLRSCLTLANPLVLIENLKTEIGKTLYRFHLLKLLMKDKQKHLKFIILLYYKLKDVPLKDEYECFSEMMNKLSKKMKDKELKQYTMKEMGNYLEPLNFWDKTTKTFDPWQSEVIQYIYNKKSVLVRAPTSSGKSFIAMAAGILYQKILFVCPAKPVVYQVGAHFMYMGYKVHFIVDNFVNHSYDSKTNIFIGTPEEIENNIHKIGVEFDYAVFDEIHNINDTCSGDTYENIIKLLSCNFLALSATVKNISHLHDIFHKIHPDKDIHYVEYNKRFMNQQRWLWKNNELIKLHPLCAIQKIDLDFKQSMISYTPNDCYKLWECIEEVMEEVDETYNILEGCSPDDYFTKDTLLTLEECSEYETFLKEKLLEWFTSYPSEIQEIVDTFQEQPSKDKYSVQDLYSFLTSLKKNDMFPAIMFHTQEKICYELFQSLLHYLETLEIQENPYHYVILEKKQELYLEYVSKKEAYESNITLGKSSNKQLEKESKMEEFERKEIQNYITSMISFYNHKLEDITKSDICKDVRKIQYNNLSKEKHRFTRSPDLCYQDIFKKHPGYVFTIGNSPMSGDTIKKIRKEIQKTLNIKIPYEHLIFQMLKRGIGIYIEEMPDEYNWIIQKLLSDKQIGIVISGKILCLGIDLPIRTSVFLGIDEDTFSKDEYLQMAGRAGRRGKDDQGNIIFYGEIDYLQLMKNELPDIVGSTYPLYQTYNVLDPKYKYDNLGKNIINPEREYKCIQDYKIPLDNTRLHWDLRRSPCSYNIINNLDTLERELYELPENSRKIYLIQKIETLFDFGDNIISPIVQMNKINNFNDITTVNQYITISMSLYNYSHKRKHLIIRKTSHEIFLLCNRINFSFIL